LVTLSANNNQFLRKHIRSCVASRLNSTTFLPAVVTREPKFEAFQEKEKWFALKRRLQFDKPLESIHTIGETKSLIKNGTTTTRVK
jgi:hypothetical protein